MTAVAAAESGPDLGPEPGSGLGTATPAVARRGWVRNIASRPLGAVCLATVALVLLTAAFGSALAPYGVEEVAGPPLAAPSGAHWMGTDNFGRDVLSRFLAGTRVSVMISLLAVLGAGLIGSALGVLAASWSGTVRDGLVMRSMDVVLAFPLLVLVPVASSILGARLGAGGTTLMIAAIIAVVFMPLFARIARASALAELREPYVEAARSYGTPSRTLLLRHVVPNLAAPLVVQAAFSIAIAIEVEAAVSFLGLGVQPPEASWGTILHDARRFLALGAWWLALFPCLGIAVAALSLNVLGDLARDELDPRLAGKRSRRGRRTSLPSARARSAA